MGRVGERGRGEVWIVGVRGNSRIGQGYGIVIGPAEIGPGNVLIVERVADGPQR